MHLPTLLREARLRAGLTQAELAARAGLTQPSVARYESGRAVPTFRLADRVLAACGLDLDARLVPRVDPDADARLRHLPPRDRLLAMPHGCAALDATRDWGRFVLTGSVAAVLLGRCEPIESVDAIVPVDGDERFWNGWITVSLTGAGEAGFAGALARAVLVDLGHRAGPTPVLPAAGPPVRE